MNMKGRVAAYSTSVNAGVIKGDDGNNYQFSNKEWLDEQAPAMQQEVEFVHTGHTRAAKVLVSKKG